ncbi:MAG TPA: helix-turn-helix transcriptional regulator [Candidatus Fimiplasma intestinipullorum]|uniref:Helix-turn-helix transcriptional regulator n=1 Tax=Candidatus Fimiplasma intestinipullorum TaxID=2840825 RepID=A0A9D1HRC3_9FIRM|nr:helix-turn-helix transcriptional regulator [Candidatus Fimiplasma intestinipullorum]
MDGINQKVLTDNLRSMEEDGLVKRTFYPEVPPRAKYALSDLGCNAFWIKAIGAIWLRINQTPKTKRIAIHQVQKNTA